MKINKNPEGRWAGENKRGEEEGVKGKLQNMIREKKGNR